MECHLSDIHAEKFAFIGWVYEQNITVLDLQMKMESKGTKQPRSINNNNNLRISEVITIIDDD